MASKDRHSRHHRMKGLDRLALRSCAVIAWAVWFTSMFVRRDRISAPFRNNCGPHLFGRPVIVVISNVTGRQRALVNRAGRERR